MMKVLPSTIFKTNNFFLLRYPSIKSRIKIKFLILKIVSYDLGISSPRSHGIAGQPLRSPRQISLCAFSDADKPLKQVTSLLMQFGQFINHDMESTSTFTFCKQKFSI